MDVGLVCDSCSAFNRMGAKSCTLCGVRLSLDVPRPKATSFSEDYTRRGIPLTDPVSIECPQCGSDVIAGHKFCGHCGAPVAQGGSGAAAAAAPAAAAPRSGPIATRGQRRTQYFGAMQASRAKLVVIKGDGIDGVSFTLAGDEHLVGRSDTAILFEDDTFISPVHANFYYDLGNLVVRDERSANGVYIRIRGSIDIRFGARFLVGEQVLEVLGPPRSQGPEAMDDGTYFFASPLRPTHFRISQALLGGATGMVYHATKGAVSIGREDNDINFPDDPFISGQHARVTLHANKLTLRDLDSKNGTFLRIDREHVLKHGDYVFMGQQLLRVEIV